MGYEQSLENVKIHKASRAQVELLDREGELQPAQSMRPANRYRKRGERQGAHKQYTHTHKEGRKEGAGGAEQRACTSDQSESRRAV